MTQIRQDCLPLPDAMKGRPVDYRGFPVPWFVTRKDDEGNWDFNTLDAARFGEALRNQRCWVSGEKLGRWKAFVIGPMCVVNGISGDPPAKLDVAKWSVKVCPFLTRPRAKRADVSEEIKAGQRGVLLDRNPGVSAIYVTDSFKVIERGICQLGEPISVTWWKEGKPALRREVMESLIDGIPVLARMAMEDGSEAEAELVSYVRRTLALAPNGAYDADREWADIMEAINEAGD